MSNLKLSSQGVWVTSDDCEITFKVERPHHRDASFNSRIDIAKRIVACVNACEGISTDNLTDNVPLKQGLTGLNQRIRDAEAQRDELLEALEDTIAMARSLSEVQNAYIEETVDAFTAGYISDLIVRVKGGAA